MWRTPSIACSTAVSPPRESAAARAALAATAGGAAYRPEETPHRVFVEPHARIGQYPPPDARTYCLVRCLDLDRQGHAPQDRGVDAGNVVARPEHGDGVLLHHPVDINLRSITVAAVVSPEERSLGRQDILRLVEEDEPVFPLHEKPLGKLQRGKTLAARRVVAFVIGFPDGPDAHARARGEHLGEFRLARSDWAVKQQVDALRAGLPGAGYDLRGEIANQARCSKSSHASAVASGWPIIAAAHSSRVAKERFETFRSGGASCR